VVALARFRPLDGFTRTRRRPRGAALACSIPRGPLRDAATRPAGAKSSMAAFSPEAPLVAGAEGPTMWDIWDTGTGATVRNAPASGRGALSVAFSPNGPPDRDRQCRRKKRPVSGVSREGSCWEAPFRQRVRPLVQTPVRSVVFSPDSSRFTHRRVANRFSLGSSSVTRSEGDAPIELNVVSCQQRGFFSHDGKLVATGGSDLVVPYLGPSAPDSNRIHSRTTGQTTDLAFSPDDRLLAAALEASRHHRRESGPCPTEI